MRTISTPISLKSDSNQGEAAPFISLKDSVEVSVQKSL